MGAENKNSQLRPATSDDLPFLKAMCYLAAFPSKATTASEQAFDEAAVDNPWLKDFVDGFGRDGDYGLIAVDGTGENLGAAWYRNYKKTGLPPYELSIAVRGGNQEQGVGNELLNGLLGHARAAGISELSLQVEPDNTRANALYEKLGFVSIAKNDGYDVMSTQLQ